MQKVALNTAKVSLSQQIQLLFYTLALSLLRKIFGSSFERYL